MAPRMLPKVKCSCPNCPIAMLAVRCPSTSIQALKLSVPSCSFGESRIRIVKRCPATDSTKHSTVFPLVVALYSSKRVPSSFAIHASNRLTFTIPDVARFYAKDWELLWWLTRKPRFVDCGARYCNYQNALTNQRNCHYHPEMFV